MTHAGCPREPLSFCSGPGDNVTFIDCDGDGRKDWACQGASGEMSVVLTTQGCKAQYRVTQDACTGVFTPCATTTVNGRCGRGRGCCPDACCSAFGFCGSGAEHCGSGCVQSYSVQACWKRT